MLGFILPPLIHFKVSKFTTLRNKAMAALRGKGEPGKGLHDVIDFIAPCLMLAFGLFILFVGTFKSLQKIAHGDVSGGGH